MRKLFVLGNGVDWCEISLSKLIKRENVYMLNEKLPLVKNHKVARIHFSNKLNKHFDVPFKSIWFRSVKKYILDNSDRNDEIVLLVFDWNVFGGEKQFVRYIRKKIKNIRIVYIFTNIVKGSYAIQKKYVEKLNEWYDVVFAFDPIDSEKYGFSYSPLIYDSDPAYDKEKDESNEDMVFYVGQAKDRLNGLLSCYEKLRSLGIICDFHIANVDEDALKYQDEIVYNKFITYSEAVDCIRKSTCLVDVVQGDSAGLTIKTCEAVCYDKKLLTTNKHVIEYPFYDSRFIRVVESADDIDSDFFSLNRDVHYSEEGKRYFSADRFLERLENELIKNG